MVDIINEPHFFRLGKCSCNNSSVYFFILVTSYGQVWLYKNLREIISYIYNVGKTLAVSYATQIVQGWVGERGTTTIKKSTPKNNNHKIALFLLLQNVLLSG